MTGTPLAAGLLLASGDQGDSPRWLGPQPDPDGQKHPGEHRKSDRARVVDVEASYVLAPHWCGEQHEHRRRLRKPSPSPATDIARTGHARQAT